MKIDIMYSNKLKVVVMPILLVLAILLGMYLNSLLSKPVAHNGINSNSFVPIQGSKMDLIMNMINYSYVDTVDIKSIEEKAIPYLLSDLDPHTVYIPAKDLQRVNEEMLGNFGGIGVQFYKYMDTVVVVKVVPGGPSEKAGLKDGDRIVRVDDSLVAGCNMNTEGIMKLMRGEVGSVVNLSLMRRGVNKLIKKEVVRGNIPIKSVDIAYMVNDTVGLVKIRTFGMNTYDEFMKSLSKLNSNGMSHLIIDLRDNEGGILPIAIKMINEFLPEGRLIVYTEGKASPRIDYNSNGKGKYQNLSISVLINEFSASASEIFAGAIQDNDRGRIYGRRSFGKGLVQEQRVLPDQSAIRLTVARYYSPSGRCIQRPYSEGKDKYYNDIYDRMKHGEFLQKDSIHFNENLKYRTLKGRVVYGGGGIMPDVFVPNDTSGFSNYLVDVTRKQQLLYEYTFDFMDQYRSKMSGIKNYKELLNYLKHFDLVDNMASYASKRGVKRDEQGLRRSYKILDTTIKSFIGRHMFDDDGFFPILYMDDTTIKEVLKHE